MTVAPAAAAETDAALSDSLETPVSDVAGEEAAAEFTPGLGADTVQPSAGDGVPGGDGADFNVPFDAEIESEIGVDSIIGADERYRIDPTTTYPARATVQLTRVIDGTTYQFCSGWLIGADTVITAGHCVYNQNDGWRQGIRAYPGRNGSSAPYGSCAAQTLYSVTGWTQNGDPDYDYGAIKLDCNIGNTVGWYGFFWTSGSLNGEGSHVPGYPADKSYGQQWSSDDQIGISGSHRLYYQNDTYGGHSGSAVYANRDGCSPCGMAVHAYGGSSYNSGARITETRFNLFKTWRDR